ncbi:MAG: ATP-binding protein [Sandarakinorhabdus sp.]|nr:ATP-binding protein [Sandarakinorhabdus sp.]
MAFIDPDKLPLLPHVALTLALAVVESSTVPLLLLDEDGIIIGVSDSFITCFELEPGDIVGQSIYSIGDGEWDLPRLRSLLSATARGAPKMPAYEIDLEMPRRGRRRLVLNAQRLDYDLVRIVRLLLAVADVTDARAAEKVKDDLLREKAVLMQEIQHRVANTLQIIASVLMTSARSIGNDEARRHLRDAHGRVLAIADLQKQLAEAPTDDVDLGVYLTHLCLSLGASMIDDPGRITLSATADGPPVAANVSVSLGLIVTELVINALKHGFPDQNAGHIKVAYTASDAGWQLVVEDDGVGIDDIDSAVPGLGTSIVNALAKHLGASITVSDGAPGTMVTITNPAIVSEPVADTVETAA